MTLTTSPTSPKPVAGPSADVPPAAPTRTADDDLPWPTLIVLGAATLVMVTGEMLPTAVLAPMSQGLGVSESAAGLLVSMWAGVVVVASMPLVRLVRGVSRRTVITGSLLVFALASVATALAPTYGVVVGARTIGAASVGLLWATVNAHVADLVPDRLLGRATAVVLGGATLGMVLGTPLGRFVADLGGWRSAFWALAVVSLAVAVLVRALVQDVARTDDSVTVGSASSRSSIRPALVVTLLVGLVLVGHYGAFTYITRLAEPAGDVLPGGIGSLLLVFGFASAAGVALAGRVLDRTAQALVVATAATAASLLALGLVGGDGVAVLVVVIAWGVTSGAMPPFAQTLVLRLAGPEHRGLAGSLIPVLFNGGIAVGAAAGAALVGVGGVGALAVPAAVVVGVAAVGLGLVARAQ